MTHQPQNEKTAGILFDYNGVLVNDEQIHKQAFQKVLDIYGINLTDDLYDHTFLGKTDQDCFKYVAKEFKSKLGSVSIKKLLQLKTNYYKKFIRKIDILYPGVEKIIRGLRKKYKLAIVTSSSRDEVVPFLSSKRLIPAFDFILTAENITRGKPNPEGYLTALKRLRLPREKVVVIEDSPNGVQSANAANLACVAVLHSVSRKRLHTADEIIGKISDLNEKIIKSVLEKITSHYEPFSP